jgi:hypothetical protein
VRLLHPDAESVQRLSRYNAQHATECTCWRGQGVGSAKAGEGNAQPHG